MLAVVLAVLLPLVLFSVFLDRQISGRLTQQVVEEALLAQATGLAQDIDRFVNDRWTDLEFFSQLELIDRALGAYRAERSFQRNAGQQDEPEIPVVEFGPALIPALRASEPLLVDRAFDVEARYRLSEALSHAVRLKPFYDLLVLLDEDGHVVATSLDDGRGRAHARPLLETIFGHPFEEDPAVQAALEGEWGAHDQHASALDVRADADDPAAHLHIAFAVPIFEEQALAIPDVRGVLYALVNWTSVQELLEGPALRDTFRGLLPDPSRQPSPYGWIWGADADTLLAHPKRELLGRSLTDDLKLAPMREDVLESANGWGLFRRYEFGGVKKSAAFHRTAPAAQGGFDWVVGVGIEEADIYARSSELRSILFAGTVLVVALVLSWVVFISNRITTPILELQRFAGRVAEGDWDVRNEVRSADEVGLLAADLNTMAERLGRQRDQLVRAEKDAAWREMARQIAHDIKNPLTPIQLSLDLLERARREGAPGSEAILERTIALVRRQVTHLQEIAGDFHEFTGGRREVPVVVALDGLMGEVLALHDAWAIERGVEVRAALEPARVFADPGKLRRVFVNLVTNALQAMPDGGRLDVTIERRAAEAIVRIRDTGTGIAEEAREHLFEPYFTTKSEGTGLGLAISHRTIEQAGGTIELVSAEDDEGGTIAVVRMPEAPA